ncbi:DUF86 domain-containing protein [Brachybacterium huguangmaarense]|uniref:DUF86 domain-containing protein n=1 Tax=Brachybacterium huguangmaarense TaxID=1652028 RepID=A0ABY6G1Z0_9MICO|nr:DUF86 domain-containing protein [Brachybacterium huguangmaarense]UYG16693.1 DUF86 domain-containing protein [Brachybacterium huguangmaarense]
MRRRSDADLIAEALTHIDRLLTYIERDGLSDDVVADAVCLRLAAAIDALNDDTVPPLGERLFGATWRSMRATRNYIAHAYAFVDMSLVSDTVDNDLPDVERVLREEYARLTRG